MQHQLFLNHLSVGHAFHSLDDFESALEMFMECLNYIGAAARGRAYEILYDEMIDQVVSIIDGTVFSSAVNNIKNKDLTRRWYLYTRNLAQLASDDRVAVLLTKFGDKAVNMNADIASEVIVFFPKWLSFKGAKFFENKELLVVEGATPSDYRVHNAVKIEDFIGMWPQFEASPKHKKFGYTKNGVYISPMPLSDEDAQAALLLSVEYQGERFVRFEKVIYRFLRTHIDREVYHGFQIENSECPISI